MEEKTEIVGGFTVKDIEEGTEFEVNNYKIVTEDEAKEEEECTRALSDFLKLECVDSKNGYDGVEPFDAIEKDMVNLLQNGKVKKKVLREGYGEKPMPSANVKIHYNAYTQYEALPFDSTYARKSPFDLTLGNEEVIPGLEIAVLSMKINEKALFLIDPELAYKNGTVGRIPPNVAVLFEIELQGVLECPIEKPILNERQFEVVYPICVALSVKAKTCVKLKDYSGAVKLYLNAATKLEDAMLNNYEEQLKNEELLLRLYINLLVCYTILELPKRGCIYAQNIYNMAKNGTFKVSAKVYFNHAKCQRMLGDFDFAKRKLLQAKAIEPNNPEILKEFEELEATKRKYQEDQARFARAFLGN